MLRKSLITLKNNPLVILLFVLVIIISAASTILLLPDINRILVISREISENSTNPAGINPQNTFEMLSATLKILLFSLVTCGFSIVFMAGFGNMLAAAVNDGKASLKIFLFGIRKFFGKILLSFLLLAALIFGFSLVLSVISIPLTITGMMGNNFDIEAMLDRQRMIQVISSVMVIFLYPFVLLWLPAIFLDRNDGVMACFRKGFKAGLKKYIMLVAVTAVMLLPTLFLFGFTENVYSIMESPFYILMFVYQAIIMPVLLTYLFTLYNEMRKEKALLS